MHPLNLINRNFMLENPLNLKSVTKKRAFLGNITTAIRKKASLLCRDDNVVFDVACGNGLLFAELSRLNPGQIKFVGVDQSDYLLNEARSIFLDNSVSGAFLVKGDIFKLPFRNKKFARITCLNTILNMPSLEKVEELLTELMDVCSDDGKIVIDVRNKLNPVIRLKYWWHARNSEFPTIAYGLKDIFNILKRRGCCISRCLTVGFPLPITASAFILEIVKNKK